MVYYTGKRLEKAGPVKVYVKDTDSPGLKMEFPPRYDLRNHSPDGFQWGYGGSGPAQLALALTAHALLGCPTGDKIALDTYQEFKRRFLAGLEGDEITIPEPFVVGFCWAESISRRGVSDEAREWFSHYLMWGGDDAA